MAVFGFLEPPPENMGPGGVSTHWRAGTAGTAVQVVPAASQGAMKAPSLEVAAEATSARLDGDRNKTRFRTHLSKGVTAEIYTLANPYRVIVDLPNVSFRLETGTGSKGLGLVKAFRYGLFAEGKARIVLDTTGPVQIERAAMAGVKDADGVFLDVELVGVSREAFGAGTGASRPAPSRRRKSEHAIPRPPKNNAKPVIVIDPGHGGIDGGTVSPSGVAEKTVVLAVAKELGRQLAGTGRYAVRMTRSSDVFVSLERRVEISQDAGADLFISLHADSLADQQFTQSIRGATIYTLSDRASDEAARLMAEKENASDLLAGIDIGDESEEDEVKGILIDLMKRETANFSTDFSNVLKGRLGKSIRLSRSPQRSAAFKVLRQTHAPSVLVELGYLSHPEDQELLQSKPWQTKAAAAIARAVRAYFAKRSARVP